MFDIDRASKVIEFVASILMTIYTAMRIGKTADEIVGKNKRKPIVKGDG